MGSAMTTNLNSRKWQMLHAIFRRSIADAVREQRLEDLVEELSGIVPDITEQYSTIKVEGPYMNTKVRAQHAFQISLVREVIGEFKEPVIVDVGDSSGTHLQYIRGLSSPGTGMKCLSVNIDEKAVEKVIRKGLQAIRARAEELHKYDVNANIFLCFEIFEHLSDPCLFLHRLSTMTKANYLIMTVPYLRKSRIGLHHIRTGCSDPVSAESTHIFELSPEDWKLLVRHSGWDVIRERVYLQYPKRGLLRITEPLWRRYDFEGFYGLILKRDDTWASKYSSW